MSNTFKEKNENYEKISEKLEEVNDKIGMVSQESENNKVGEIKKSIASLEK